MSSQKLFNGKNVNITRQGSFLTKYIISALLIELLFLIFCKRTISYFRSKNVYAK